MFDSVMSTFKAFFNALVPFRNLNGTNFMTVYQDENQL
jgi:hypothetical protein